MTRVRITTKYIDEEGEVVKAAYADGQLALILAQGGTMIEKLSINLIGHGLIAPEGHVYVKNYAEAEGLDLAMALAGIAVPVSAVAYGPYNATATLMKVTI